jgi:hypothetical protein
VEGSETHAHDRCLAECAMHHVPAMFVRTSIYAEGTKEGQIKRQ